MLMQASEGKQMVQSVESIITLTLFSQVGGGGKEDSVGG